MTSCVPEPFDGRVPPPRFANLETTLFCNLQCPMCLQFQAGTTTRGPHMPPEVFDRAARQLFPFIHAVELSTAGEPLVSRNLDRILAETKRWGVRVNLYSNGTLLDDRMVRRILPCLGTLHVSFDGATKDTFEAIRAGARFERVLANVRRVVRAARGIPIEKRPVIVLAVTLMERNIDEFPDLVDLASDLGVDRIVAAHVYAGTERARRHSLAHHRARARLAIDEALRRARRRGLECHVAALDGKVQALAEASGPTSMTGAPESRTPHAGAPDGLAARSYASRESQPGGGMGPADGSEEVRELRREARARASFVARDAGEPSRDAGPRALRQPPAAPIWVCDFLWNKIYVTVLGRVIPCCVPGRPEVGDLRRQDLQEIWDGPAYRAMRHALVRRDPVSACRGCQHIREVREDEEKHRWLQGRAVPEASTVEALGPLPEVLRPYRFHPTGDRHGADGAAAAGTAGAPAAATEISFAGPTARLRWDPHPEAARYEVQLSVDGFRTISFSTDWHEIELREACFGIPGWLLAKIPAGRPVAWRAIAVRPTERLEVAWGRLRREDDGAAT